MYDGSALRFTLHSHTMQTGKCAEARGGERCPQVPLRFIVNLNLLCAKNACIGRLCAASSREDEETLSSRTSFSQHPSTQDVCVVGALAAAMHNASVPGLE